MNSEQSSRYREAKLTVESLDLSVFRFSILVRLLRMIDHYKTDSVHWNFYPPANPYAILSHLIRPAVRHFQTDHNSRPTSQNGRKAGSWKTEIKRRVFAATYSEIFAVSDYVRSDLKDQGIWKAPKRYHHFINTDRFRPDCSVRSQLRGSMGHENSFVILVVAHLIPEKGVDIAMHALGKLPAKAVLWVVGDGPERIRLQTLAESLGVQKRIFFLGLHTDVSRFMQAADCFVCPSLWQEAAGLVILEAMSCGLPVIASETGGIPEFVMSGHTGYLVPTGDPAALADRMASWLNSRTLLETMSESARDTAVTHFSHEAGVANALSLYD